MKLRDLLLGRPLATEDADAERIGTVTAVPVLGLDALASAAYGPEALLTALLPLGAGALRYVSWLTAAVLVLLALVFGSYLQTIGAYPKGAGAYSVARQNLGTRTALLAAAALAVDYVLNAAVAISAGAGALISIWPALEHHTLGLCVIALVGLTLVNLRGVRVSGHVFSLPTYGFVLTLLLVIAIGLWRHFVSGVPPSPHSAVRLAAPPASGWLLARAFASGCTAMTGVEAVSNAVPLFREPAATRARRTLTLIVVVLACLLAGLAFLVEVNGIVAREPGSPVYRSVISLTASAVVGRGPLYFATLLSTTTVLLLSANTSFSGFPLLCATLAKDGFLPEALAHRGRRLGYSTAIVVLSVLAGLLLVVFGGVTDALIPLFAIGALLAFTLSQVAMGAHWRRIGNGVSSRGLFLNAAGGLATGAALLVAVITKLREGAWLSVLLIAALAWLLHAVKSRYDRITRLTTSDSPLVPTPIEHPVVVVPIRRWDAVSLKALELGATWGRRVFVLQVSTGDLDPEDLAKRWAELVEAPMRERGAAPAELVRLQSSYRDLYGPVVAFVTDLLSLCPGQHVAVVLPHLIEDHPFHYLLHNESVALLRELLLHHGDPRVVVVEVPWYMRESPLAAGRS